MDRAALKERLTALNMKIDKVSDLFYQQKDSEGLEAMKFVIDDMMSAASGLDACARADNCFSFDANGFLGVLKQALDAMAKKDYVMLSDVLKYDLSEILSKYIEALNG